MSKIEKLISIVKRDSLNQEKKLPQEEINKKAVDASEDTSVKITFPSELHIELVQANEVRNYEIFQWLTTMTTTIGAAFGTGYFLTEDAAGKTGLGWSAIVFVTMSFLFIGLAIMYRRRAFSKKIEKSICLTEFKSNKPKK